MPNNVQFLFLAVRKLHAIHFWIKEYNRTRKDLFPASIDDTAVTEYTNQLRNDEHKIDAAKSQVLSKPEVLKAMIGCMKCFDKVQNNLGQIRGSARIPRTYTI